MNKITGFMIVMMLSAALVFVAPQAFAASGASPSMTSSQPGITGLDTGEGYPANPPVTCEVEHGAPRNIDLGHMDYYSHAGELKSTCLSGGASVPSDDVNRMGVQEGWPY